MWGPLDRRLDQPAGTYFDLSQWSKGCVWLNGHHLGRYWEIGPTQTMHMPAEWLKKGQNGVVLKLLKPEQDKLSGVDKPMRDVVKPDDEARKTN